MSKKILITALAGVAVVGLSSAALAQNFNTSNSDIYIGIQGGYGDTHGSDLNSSNSTTLPVIFENGDTGTLTNNYKQTLKGTGVAGRLFAGVDFNQYLAVESGFTYFPKTDVNISNQTILTDTNTGASLTAGVAGSGSYSTYGVDLLAKISVPLVDNFGLYAKAGPGYLHTGDSGNLKDGTNNAVLVYGFGADYAITPHLVADASFTRFNGNHKADSNNFQPDADLYAIGLAYKFNV